MVGYPEALTDPSYRGQILVLTFPLIGNYGVPDEGIKDAYGLPEYFESNQMHIAGLVVSSYSWEHSHWAAHKSLAKWLKDNNIPGIYGVDTRALTMKIRSIGALLGNLVVVSLLWMPLLFSISTADLDTCDLLTMYVCFDLLSMPSLSSTTSNTHHRTHPPLSNLICSPIPTNVTSPKKSPQKKLRYTVNKTLPPSLPTIAV